MIATLDRVRRLLTAFDRGELAPIEFANRYAQAWSELVREQDAAIAAHPTVGPALTELRRRLDAGELDADAFSVAVDAEYAKLPALALPPGSAEAAALDQLFVEVDAYRPEVADQIAPNLDDEQLRDRVRIALVRLGPDPAVTGAEG